MNLQTDNMHELTRLIHAKRVRIDPQYRGELIRLFDNPRARMAYFSKTGLTVDQLGEAIWDARLSHERPTCDEVLELLERIFTPGAIRAKVARSEVRDALGEVQESLSRELEVRRKNRWRVFECSCFKSAKVRIAADVLPPALARATCDQCGAPWTLRTIKLDLSNRNVPMTAEEIYAQ